VIEMRNQKQNKNKSKNLYDTYVWAPLRKEGLGKHGVVLVENLPRIPVVVNKAKKNAGVPDPITAGNFVFVYPSWDALLADYRNLVVRVAHIYDTMTA